MAVVLPVLDVIRHWELGPASSAAPTCTYSPGSSYTAMWLKLRLGVPCNHSANNPLARGGSIACEQQTRSAYSIGTHEVC